MAFSAEIERFIREYSRELADENAAVFAGAGLSVGAGYVNWIELLRPIAEDIDLDVEREHDLVTLAQYHVNQHAGNRGRLNKALIEEFSKNAEPTQNHVLLARLPISIYWTTNYDNQIEKALEQAGKRADVKYNTKQLQLTGSGRDAIVYKMHGDANNPADAVLIKDDYEQYHRRHELFLTALGGDLVSKTFLFLGLSFSDPNLDYILSRVRVWLGRDQRQHYALLRRVAREDFDEEADYEYELRRQELFVGDLLRFNIKGLLIENYGDITRILSRLYRTYRSRSVLISGSAVEYGRWEREGAELLVHRIGRELIKREFRVVSGFGLGIGSSVISGALEEIYNRSSSIVGDELVLRPFPRSSSHVGRYRRDLVALAGTAVFLFGNKRKGRGTALASGVEREFEMAVEAGVNVVPIGATGFVAERLWDKVHSDMDEYFPGVRGIKRSFAKLGGRDAGEEDIIEALFDVLEKVS